MDRSEPALIPEWLKSSGNTSGGGYGNHQSPSCLNSDDHSVSKHSRNKSPFINSERDGSRSYVSEKATSNYFRRSTSGKDSSRSRSYGFNRSHRDREFEDLPDYSNSDRSTLGDQKHPYADPMGGVLPGKFSKDTLRRSQSLVSRKIEWNLRKKVADDSVDASNNSNHMNSSSLLLSVGGVSSSIHSSFGREFPSLGSDLKQSASELKRVPSPVLPSAAHNLPSAGPNAIGGDGWTSSLAEVPGVIASNNTASLPSQQVVSGSSVPLAQRGLNMAEAVAQGPSRARTPPQVSVDNQRLEELAIKQSRQLIPVTPSTPKPVLGPSDKSKKAGAQQSQFLASHGNQIVRGVPARLDSGKTFTTASLGKLQVLKPAREVNGVSSTVVKENMSPRNGVKVVNTPLSLNPTAAATTAPLRVPANIQNPAVPERKSAGAISANSEKRLLSVQSQSRIDFFNLLKKKNSSSTSNVPSGNEAVPSAMDKSPDSVAEGSTAASAIGADYATSDGKPDFSSEMQNQNDDEVMANGEGDERIRYFAGNGEDESEPETDVPYPNEEEAAFLRSLGWEENAGEDGGLTEDEIRAFYELMKMKPRSGLMSVQLKVNNNNGSCVSSSTGL